MQMPCPSYDKGVCLSVYLWHTAILSRRRKPGSWNLHC